MSADTGFAIHPMNRAELDIAIAWANVEGWNPGQYDGDAFFASDPSGYFLGTLGGEPVSCISAVSYGKTFGFIGFYIVAPKHRGKGYGLSTWNHAMDYLNGRVIGLDGVTAQQDNYAKSGFRLAYRNMRFAGTGGGERPAGLVDLKALPFECIRDYDRAFFPAPRDVFLKSWLQLPYSTALGILEDGRLTGYGVLRSCVSGFKMGPLFADSEQYAERLFAGLASQVPDQPIFLDIPEPNAAARALVERHEMQFAFETARMYSGVAPQLPLDRLFGVTTFELG